MQVLKTDGTRATTDVTLTRAATDADTTLSDLVTKIQTYFSESVGRSVELATWRSREAPLLERERTLAMLHSARLVFAGPDGPRPGFSRGRTSGRSGP